MWSTTVGERDMVQDIRIDLEAIVRVFVVWDGGRADVNVHSSSAAAVACCGAEGCGGGAVNPPSRSFDDCDEWEACDDGCIDCWNWNGDAPRGVCDDSAANGSGFGDGATF